MAQGPGRLVHTVRTHLGRHKDAFSCMRPAHSPAFTCETPNTPESRSLCLSVRHAFTKGRGGAALRWKSSPGL
ncbi:hypothetical protein CVIRNUC_000213 [Coccomyxa viridis]|uniref:Uncharacterized protein n=1 Tax=Coccomyxa viridis TaxID=1274662 RepID=A0AAV1HTI8_9CHLO|nr:hypothetical protein CVIRNUC_000213 [Coccomyxa viridis]